MNAVRKSIATAIAVAALGLTAGSVAVSNAVAAPSGDASQQSAFDSHEAKFAERMAKRQTALHDKLGLSTAQEAAWKTFTDRLQATAPVRSESAPVANMTAPERADRMVAFLQTAEQRAATRAQAIKEFYSSLSPEQQKVFDSQFQGRHHRHHGRHHGQG